MKGSSVAPPSSGHQETDRRNDTAYEKLLRSPAPTTDPAI
ncbi:MAG: hypothetical protein QOF31_198, partial [Mycobacterium sp.]|nr:hypothetical protein [Mycobacterium sp.]